MSDQESDTKSEQKPEQKPDPASARSVELAVAVQNATGDTRVPPLERIREWATLAVAGTARGEITVRIVGTNESADLNQRYRDRRGPTNVLAFLTEPPSTPPAVGAELLPLGDLVICAPVLAREAREQRKPLEAHWAHIVMHGVLHLLGYDHETEDQAALMEGRERELLAQLGFADPYSPRG